MNREKLLEQFYAQVIDIPETNRNANTLRDVLAANDWGRNEIEPIQDIYSGYCRNHNIKLDDLILAEYYTVTAEGKAKENEAETNKRINEHITEYKAGGSATDLHEKIHRELQQLKSERNRFTAWADYFNKCVTYDPSKDFKPSMLAGLRFPNGTLSYIGARPGGGKSTMLVNLAREALAADRNVFLVNLEMLNTAIITNYALSLMYANAAAKQRQELTAINHPMGNYYSLFKREYDSRETFNLLRHNALETIETVLNKNLFIYDGTGGKLEPIIKDIESRVSAGDVVLIDYIQRMPPLKEGNDPRYIQVKQTSNELLTLAIKKNVVIISGAQFGRQTKDNRGKEATTEDFRESGDIEQDAHNALAIETIANSAGEPTGRYIHVLKQREGGAALMRELLECNFNYLYIAGTGKEYIPPKSKGKTKETTKVYNQNGIESEVEFNGEEPL